MKTVFGLSLGSNYQNHNLCMQITWTGKDYQGNPSFYSEKNYSQVENIQDSCQFSQEWKSQQVHHKVRLCSAQRNCKTPREASRILAKFQSLLASVGLLNVEVHDDTISNLNDLKQCCA